MKLKYYLRGLGIGLFIATIILSISFSARDKTLTNVEIMNKAEELGMVKAEDVDRTVSEKLEKIRQEETAKEETAEEEAAKEETAKEEALVEETVEEISQEEVAEEDNPESITTEGSITIVISSGMWSEEVSELLENKQMIDSAGEFNSYLVKNGYQHKIRTGEYTFSHGISFEEIAKTITSR